MVMSLYCKSCDRRFPYSNKTAKINGPMIETMCPFCGKISERNLSAFLWDATSGSSYKTICRAIEMINLNHVINKSLNS